ncbi:shadow of prion protein [Chlamydotis macqueenii]
MRRGAAACWALLLLAAALCDTAAGKGGRGGARGAARGRGAAARGQARAARPRYGSALRVAAGAAAAGAAAGAALRRARLTGQLETGDGLEYGAGNRTSATPGRPRPGWAVSWLCPLAAALRP